MSVPSGFQFEPLCRLARTVFDVPAASICIRSKPSCWADLDESLDPGAWSFVKRLDSLPDAGAGLMWVTDMTAERSCSVLPCVESEPGLRFFASIPFGRDGTGRLALFDTKRHERLPEAIGLLKDLGAVAAQCLTFLQNAQDAAEQGARFRRLADMTTDTIVHGDLDGNRLYISPSVRRLLGFEPEELIGGKASDITHPDDLPEFGALMQKIHEGQLDVGTIELRQRHKNGDWIWMEASVRLTHDPVTGKPDGYVSTVRETGHRKERETNLIYQASYDELTDLPNRKSFSRRLGETIERMMQSGRGFNLLYMDLDRFKQVNDGLGHQAGDAVLTEVAQRFRAVLRAQDTVARLGGDEFAVIMEAGRTDAARLSERLIAEIGRPFRYDGRDISIGLSIGIACAPAHGATREELLSSADLALYRAKGEGRNRFCFFEPSGGNSPS